MLGFAVLISSFFAQASQPEGKLSAPPLLTADEVAVKGLAFLEKEGIAWTKEKKCASCHHVPMMLWSQEEARRHGIAINREIRQSALAFALNAPRTGFWGPLAPEKLAAIPGPSLEIIYLLLGIGPERTGEGASAKKTAELEAHLFDKQEPNGSWIFTRKEKGKLLAPIQDSDEVVTLLALLAESSNPVPAADQGRLMNSREKAMSWLKDSSLKSSDQARALGLVVLKRFGVDERVHPLATELLSKQREDGGWSQSDERPSDALATGQVLFALAAAGLAESHLEIHRAREFLAHTQRKDGSWLVTSRQDKGNDPIASYFGSAWAIIGLVQYCSKQ